MRVILLLFVLFQVIHTSAQQKAVLDTVYSADYLTRSTKFAWTTFGADFLQLSGGSAEYLNNGVLNEADFNGAFIPRLSIGGIHFWGHADFYVRFPLGFLSAQSVPNEFQQFTYFQSVETGARYYPFALRSNALRPYVGLNFRTLSFGFEPRNSGFTVAFPSYQEFIVPLQAGITYASDKYLFSAGIHYQTKRSIRYSLSETQKGSVDFDPISFEFGIMRYVDLDRNARTKEGIIYNNKKHHLLAEKKGLSAFYLGIGPSSFMQLTSNEYLDLNFPHLADDNLSSFAADITAGYYFEKPDLNIGISFRSARAQGKSIDDVIKTRRRSYMVEAYKFLFNYLGFVPYFGLTGSMENLRTEINGEIFETTKPALGFIFGWDIRVVKTETGLLRTNLRYVPGLHMDINGDRMMFDHLEFNFIQYVHFIGRKRKLKN